MVLIETCSHSLNDIDSQQAQAELECSCREVAQETADRIRETGTPVVVGGPGRRLDDLVREVRDAVALR